MSTEHRAAKAPPVPTTLHDTGLTADQLEQLLVKTLYVGEASGHDLELLGETVRARVLETSGVRLDWEIKRMGRFGASGVVEPFLGRG